MGRGLKITLVIAAAQLLTTLVSASLAFAFYTQATMQSVIIGGAISVVTTLLFGWRTFAGGRFQPAEKMLVALYTGELLKIALTIVLFIVAIKWLGAAFLPMIIAYAMTLMVFLLMLPFRLI